MRGGGLGAPVTGLGEAVQLEEITINRNRLTSVKFDSYIGRAQNYVQVYSG